MSYTHRLLQMLENAQQYVDPEEDINYDLELMYTLQHIYLLPDNLEEFLLKTYPWFPLLCKCAAMLYLETESANFDLMYRILDESYDAELRDHSPESQEHLQFAAEKVYLFLIQNQEVIDVYLASKYRCCINLLHLAGIDTSELLDLDTRSHQFITDYIRLNPL